MNVSELPGRCYGEGGTGRTQACRHCACAPCHRPYTPTFSQLPPKSRASIRWQSKPGAPQQLGFCEHVSVSAAHLYLEGTVGAVAVARFSSISARGYQANVMSAWQAGRPVAGLARKRVHDWSCF